MKITTNFIKSGQWLFMPVTVSLWLVAVLFGTGAIWLARDAADQNGDLPQLRERLARLTEQGRANEASSKVSYVLPSVRDLAETRERVARINAKAQTKGVPTLTLLADIERQLPPEAWLTSFHHRAIEGEVSLVASAMSAAPLSAFMLKLEEDPLFEEALLVRESQPGGGSQNVQFEIRLKVRA